GDPNLSQNDINGLTNEGKYFLAVGNCCLTSTYDYDECFGETFLRAENKGAIGYIGGSNSTYWDEDYWWGVGFHPSGEIDGSAHAYEETGLGAYDGLFHDHAEAEHLWYVTNDAVVFSGNLAVMESGSTRTTYYWNIYNLLGDPSLSTYMGVPGTNDVGHVDTIFMGQTSLNVAAAHGTYVGLTQNGQLVGSGTVGATGNVDIEYTQLLTPGIPVKMVAMAQNLEPYVAEIMVIVPATVTLDPSVIDVNTPTDITVTVMEADNVTPKPGINIWAEGLDYSTDPVMTDANGVAIVSVNYAYGPTLNIVGQDPAETYRLFTEPVQVNALELTNPDLTVSTGIGLDDAFALNLPGTLSANVGEGGATVVAFLPDGTQLSAPAPDLMVTPTQLGMVTGQIALDGYNIYTETFEVIEAYGTLSGTITSGGSPLAGVLVTGEDMDGTPVFTAMTDADGLYTVADEQLVDTYHIVVDHFGYLHFEQEFFLNYGANTFDIALDAAPAGILAGSVVDSETSEPLQATVYVFRTDTDELFTQVLCAEDGTFETGDLPYFTYDIRVRAYQHVPATVQVEIMQPETVKNFALEPTNGDILLIDDGAAAGPREAKFGGKNNDVLLANGYMAMGGKSASVMAEDLTNMGFYVTTVSAAEVDLAEFDLVDLVILSCSDNYSTLSNAALEAALVDFAQMGGKILLEGGELGYSQAYSGDFAEYVMHSSDWNHDNSGSITVADPDAYILNHPNPGCGEISFNYSGYGDSDSMAPNADAAMPLSWSSYPTDASMITYDPNPAPEGGQIVFFTWNYLAAGEGRYALLENAVHWLLTPEFGTSAASGTAMLAGEDNHAGITITARPNGGTTTTAADGSWSLEGLFAGEYTITASKPGWSTEIEVVTLEEGQTLTDVNFVLSEVTVAEVCSAPGLAIPDAAPGGVSDTVVMDLAGEISAVEVFLDISHTFQGDLLVTLTSPAGTTVNLHNRTGGGDDNIYGWYPAELDPDGDLEDFVGEEMSGEWTLFVSDNAGADTGTLNEWCVKVTYSVVVAMGAQPMLANPVSGGTDLSWDYNPALVDGFNVYRRTEDSARVQLNSTLLTSTNGHIQFTDAGEGLESGQIVFYSYGMMINGQEIRGDELEVEFLSGLPTVFALRSNYPNPFNPATTIKFDLPRSSHVKLNIYDVAGRLVRTLVDEVRPAQTHEVMWDGTDRGGRRVSSGTYYYVLQAGDFKATNKMMLVK
ncbi:hypothetical protein CSB20_05420, partial [bacterium DOLZORAL124_64_63]